MSIEIWRSDDAADVLDRAGELLRSEPVLHNLVLSFLGSRTTHPLPGRYWIAVEDAVPVGVVFRSPLSFPVTLTPMSSTAIDAVVDAVVADGEELPGVNGEAGTAARFAGQWTERYGGAARPEMGMRLYELDRLVDRVDPPGRARLASAPDTAVVETMVRGFHEDTGESGEVGVEEWAAARIALGQVWLWDDDGPTAMAVHTSPQAGCVRVQAVYTPPSLRRRGYAGAVVSALSALMVDAGHRVLLFTDLGNPTSNSVYRSIGFRAVGENLRYVFE